MRIIESMRRKSAFVIIICLFLWIGRDVNNVSGWEIDALQRKLQEKGAKWTAGETSLSHLSTEEFKQMLGLKLHRQIKAMPLKGWGYTYYDLTGNDKAMSTLMGVPAGSQPIKSFVAGQPPHSLDNTQGASRLSRQHRHDG